MGDCCLRAWFTWVDIKPAATQPANQMPSQQTNHSGQPMSNSSNKLHCRFPYCMTGTATTPQLQLLHHRECDCTVNTYTSQHFHVHCFLVPGLFCNLGISLPVYLCGLGFFVLPFLFVLMDSAASDLFGDINSCCDSDESRGASDSSRHDPREWSVDPPDNESGASHSVLLRSDCTAVACGMIGWDSATSQIW